MSRYKFISIYEVTPHPTEAGMVEFFPKACFSIEKFSVSYESGDYEELSDIECVRRAREFARKHLGCKFYGDSNPATGSTLGHCWSTAPCTHYSYTEMKPFERAYNSTPNKVNHL